MALSTFSIFYFGYEVDSLNFYLPFKEGVGPELTAEVDVGSFTLSEILVAVKTALDAAGALTYTVSVDRNTRHVTISTTSTFSLLVTSGATAGSSIFSLLGFTGADRTGASSYTGNLPSGSEYRPQFLLQDHVAKENFQKAVEATVRKTATGKPEIVTFGTEKFVQINNKFISDIHIGGPDFKNNPTGVLDAQTFMQHITKKRPVEFMPDISSRSLYDKLILEKTPESENGTGYELKELKDIAGIFETGILLFRVIEV